MATELVTERPLKAAEQKHLQEIAEKIARADALIAEGEVLRAEAIEDLAKVAQSFGAELQTMVYAGSDVLEGKRLSRLVAWPREFDLGGLKEALKPAQFKRITKLVTGSTLIDAALKTGIVSKADIEPFTTETPQVRVALRDAGPRAALKLQSGCVAIVSRETGAES